MKRTSLYIATCFGLLTMWTSSTVYADTAKEPEKPSVTEMSKQLPEDTFKYDEDEYLDLKQIAADLEQTIKITGTKTSQAKSKQVELFNVKSKLTTIENHIAEEKAKAEKAEKEAKEKAEKEAKEKAEKEAQEAREKAEREEKEARERAEQEAREQAEQATQTQHTETTSSSDSTTPTTYSGNISDARTALVNKAKEFLGVPYVWGGTSPSPGFDCSGLTSYVYRHALGMEIGRTTWNQDASGRHIALSEMQPGDLIITTNVNHVTMYIGNGQQIEAPLPGDVVKISAVRGDAMYGLRYVD